MRTLLPLSMLALSGCLSLDQFLYTPSRKAVYDLNPEGASPEETVTADRIEPVTITVNEQVTLGAAYLKGNVQPPSAYVIFFHGKGGTLDSAFPRAKRWSNLGYDVLVFDYRGWGNSTDLTPTEEGLLEDTRAARAWMLERIGPANANKLVYYGQSLGTAISTQLAEQEPPQLLVLESGFASIYDFQTDSSGLYFPVGFIAKATWPTAERVRDLHVPLLLIHGLADDFVRPEFSEKIYANANEPKKLELVAGAGHSDIPLIMPPGGYAALINEFIGAHLPP